MSGKKSMIVDAATAAGVDVAKAKQQAYAIASRKAKADGHTPEDIRTIAMGAAVATEQALVRAAKGAAPASAGSSGSDRHPPTKRRKAASRSGGDLNSREHSAPRHASATSGTAYGGPSTNTSSPTIFIDLSDPMPNNGDTPMAPTTAQTAPGWAIDAPLVPGYWLGPRVDASHQVLGAMSPATREAACTRRVSTGFMEPSLLVRAASPE